VSEFSPSNRPTPVVAPPAARPAYPAFPPPPYPPPGPPRRRWPALAMAAAAGAAVAATIASVIAAQLATDRAESARSAPSPVTVTATPAPPPPPAPLPTAQADRQTCNAWLAAGDKIHAASGVLAVIPKGTTLVDQAVRDNPDWSAAVHRAADLYEQAGETLTNGIAPGTTIILERAATTAASALRTVSTADMTMDAIDGNAFDAWKESADTVNVLCERLAPR